MPLVLYRRQAQILEFIRQYIDANGFAPTLKQIAKAIGVSSLATVHEHLQALERKGLLKKKIGATRGLLLTDHIPHISRGLEVPILGYIAAGSPIEPHTDPNAFISISPSMISSKKRVYVLQVRGDSMIDDGILNNDYVVIEQQEQADNGDIVVAMLDNGLVTLKRFYKEATRVRLEPANKSMSPIFAKNVKVQGKVVGIIRKYIS